MTMNLLYSSMNEPILMTCEDCNGSGGYDRSTDCEVYDDWQECPFCEGTGEVEV